MKGRGRAVGYNMRWKFGVEKTLSTIFKIPSAHSLHSSVLHVVLLSHAGHRDLSPHRHTTILAFHQHYPVQSPTDAPVPP